VKGRDKAVVFVRSDPKLAQELDTMTRKALNEDPTLLEADDSGEVRSDDKAEEEEEEEELDGAYVI
jgi:hypothetical protein